MSSSYGENIEVTIFGQSHSSGIGMTLQGVPAGEELDLEELSKFLARRAPGRNEYSSPRREPDEPEFLCGIFNGKTCGTPITAIIRNKDRRSEDYSALKDLPRPGHADYTANIKYFGAQDYRGGGHFSGRLTAALCIAGGICKQLLEKEGIQIIARISSIGPIKDRGELFSSVADKAFPVCDDEMGEKMREYIAERKAEGDSVGGTVECSVLGVPAGLGDPMFDGMENRIAKAVFAIPAVKGLEFGIGFGASELTGSENNDGMYYEGGEIHTVTNHAGGILGGITNGMPVTFRVGFKPTPSITKAQRSVNLTTKEDEGLMITGRHDPCIVPRAVPVVEAAAAIAVYDALLARKREL
jgi:chorismate synthase